MAIAIVEWWGHFPRADFHGEGGIALWSQL